MLKWLQNTLLAFGVTLFMTQAAAAHEFTLFYLVPPQTNAADQDDMRTAFLIASHERDTHPDETSDGHLGGVDVHLTIMALTGDEMLMALQPDLAAIPVEWEGQDAVLARFATAPAALPPSPDRRAAYLSAAGDPDLPAFADAYLAATGQMASELATASYAMARMIDEAVRPLDGTTPADALRATLDRLHGE